MEQSIYDEHGYRLNVGMVIINQAGQVFWGCRNDPLDAWQFPQGGMLGNETPREAMQRELHEEVGLAGQDVKVLAESQSWLTYKLPNRSYIHDGGRCIGQKQRWFLLQLCKDDNLINLTCSPTPEFSQWRWVDYWYPVEHIVQFKRAVYKKVLTEFESYLPKAI